MKTYSEKKKVIAKSSDKIPVVYTFPDTTNQLAIITLFTKYKEINVIHRSIAKEYQKRKRKVSKAIRIW